MPTPAPSSTALFQRPVARRATPTTAGPMMTFGLIAAALLLAVPAASAAVESVTVYPDRASVTRVVTERVGPAQAELVIDDLPVGLDRDSLRVGATGPEGLRIGALDFDIVRGSERVNPAARDLTERIEALEAERAGVADRIAARDLQLNLLQRVVAPSGDNAPDPADLLAQLDRIGEQADRVYAERRELLERQAALSEDIERLQRQLADLGNQQQDRLELRIALDAPNAGSARFTIDYTVGGASWRPVYEWQLDTRAGDLTLVQSAEVRQATGEDWSGARVAVSLARPSSGGALPQLYPWWIDVAQPAPQALRSRNAAESAADVARFAESPAPGKAAGHAQAELAGPALTQRYDLPGRVAIPSDNQPHRFRLDERTLEAELAARAVPSRQPAAWTFVEAEWTGDAALPPGPVQLFQDGASMGRAGFPGAAPGAIIESSFGVDDRIEIDYDLVRQEREVTGLLSKTVRELREHRITITNRHARPVSLTVLDQLPVSRDERIEIRLTDRSTAPDRRDVDDQPGRIAWDLELAPGQTRELVLGVVVSWPEDLPGIMGW
ncbi:mucoidy inhibitor MuiA family protein [Halomonas denitrificans]|nr:mucoidy inhibitor MuiA family protein [Halomonas denitrificans]